MPEGNNAQDNTPAKTQTNLGKLIRSKYREDYYIFEFQYKKLAFTLEDNKENFLGEGGYGAVFKAYEVFNKDDIKQQVEHAISQWVAKVSTSQPKDNVTRITQQFYTTSDVHPLPKVDNSAPDAYVTFTKNLGETNLDHVRFDNLTNQLKVITQVASQLVDMHYPSKNSGKTPIIHGDIKGDNIIVDAYNNKNITDFDLAYFLEDEALHSPLFKIAGANRSCSPEIPHIIVPPEVTRPDYCGQGCMERRSDVYSLSFLTLEILGKKFVDQMDRPNIEDYIGDLGFGEEGFDFTLNVKRMVNKMWDDSPTCRPTSKQVQYFFENAYYYCQIKDHETKAQLTEEQQQAKQIYKAKMILSSLVSENWPNNPIPHDAHKTLEALFEQLTQDDCQQIIEEKNQLNLPGIEAYYALIQNNIYDDKEKAWDFIINQDNELACRSLAGLNQFAQLNNLENRDIAEQIVSENGLGDYQLEALAALRYCNFSLKAIDANDILSKIQNKYTDQQLQTLTKVAFSGYTFDSLLGSFLLNADDDEADIEDKFNMIQLCESHGVSNLEALLNQDTQPLLTSNEQWGQQYRQFIISFIRSDNQKAQNHMQSIKSLEALHQLQSSKNFSEWSNGDINQSKLGLQYIQENKQLLRQYFESEKVQQWLAACTTGLYAKLDQEKAALLKIKQKSCHFSLFRTPSLHHRLLAINDFIGLTKARLTGKKLTENEDKPYGEQVKGYSDLLQKEAENNPPKSKSILDNAYKALTREDDRIADIVSELSKAYNLSYNLFASDEHEIDLGGEEHSKTYPA